MASLHRERVRVPPAQHEAEHLQVREPAGQAPLTRAFRDANGESQVQGVEPEGGAHADAVLLGEEGGRDAGNKH